MQLYLLKSCQVPQSRVHQKLVHATHVIIALLRDKQRHSLEVKVYPQEVKEHSQEIKVQPQEVKVQPTPIQKTDIQTQTEAIEISKPIVQSEQLTDEEVTVVSHREIPHIIGDFPLVSDGEFPPLRFTDSSLGSLGSVLDMVERELSDTPRGASTPTEPRPVVDTRLELIGHKAKENVRPGPPKVKLQQIPKPQVKKTKRFVRNYNIKD